MLPFEATSEDAHPSCARAVFSPNRHVQNLHVRRLHESTNEPAENKQRRHSVSVERDSWRSSTGESVLADTDLWRLLIGQRHVGSPLGYAPGNLSPLTCIRATYGASQQPRAATLGMPFDNQCSDRTGAHLAPTPLYRTNKRHLSAGRAQKGSSATLAGWWKEWLPRRAHDRV